MAGQGSLRAVLGGGGGIPVNSFVDMYETDNIINKEGAVYFKTGYVDTDVASYPDAQKRTWQLPVVSTIGSSLGGSGLQYSNMEYRFSRWIIASNDQAATGGFLIKSTNNFTFSPDVTFSTNYSENIGVQSLANKPKLIWNSANSTLYCYVNNAAKRYKTTDGTNWTSDALTGLTSAKFISDVILFGTTWVAIADDGIYSSADGLAWTLRQAWSITGTTTKPAKLTTNGSTIVAMSDEASNYYTSTNGTTWASVSTPSGYVTKAQSDFGDGKWGAVFKQTLTSNVVTGTSTNTTTWVVSQSPITLLPEMRWHSTLAQWVMGVGNMYSKDGINWVTVTTDLSKGLAGWVIVSNETYGFTQISGIKTAGRSQSLPEVVGLPYSLVSITVSPNKYLRVR